eukprot:10617586-Ditylum_brightwellii.AAC.1
MVDYQNTDFKTADLTKIHGEPIMATLLTLQHELKANTQSVQSTLGGGNNSHLCLVLTPAAYGRIPGTVPYTRPTHPLPNLPASGTQYRIVHAQTAYMDALCLYDQVNDVERELKNKLSQLSTRNILKQQEIQAPTI